MTSKTAVRGIFGTLLDRLVGRYLGLHPEVSNYTIEGIRIPLEDNVHLAADLYLPVNATPLGTLFVPSPYGIGLPSSIPHARLFAARGYQVLYSSCRGTFASEGEFEPGQNEVKDGQAIVRWMREQSWYTGSFATLGGSYLGYNQWALLSDPPEDMKAAVIWTGLQDFGDMIWGSGAFNGSMIGWADIQRRMCRQDSAFSTIMSLRSLKDRLQPVFDSAPLLNAVDKYFEGDVPQWLHDMMSYPDTNAVYWKSVNQSIGVEKAKIPILLTAGWDDLLLTQVMNQYERLSERGCTVALTVGPWTHLGAQGRNCLPESFKWLEEHLCQQRSAMRTSPVRIYVTGLNEWRNMQSWPSTAPHMSFYLNADNSLSQSASSVGSPSTAFVFNPADPTPSVGLTTIFDSGSDRRENNQVLATRSDTLVYDTDDLREDIEVCGKPVVELQHSTDNPHADLLVLLCEVNERGNVSRTISEKFLRLPTDRDSKSLNLVLSDCAHRFLVGTKIRLLIAGGAHPRYIRNLGTGEDSTRGEKMQRVQHTVWHDESKASKLVLPVTVTQA